MGSKNKHSKNKDRDSKTDVAQDNGGSNKLITDPRFSSVHSDPRFAKFTKFKTKVSIDSRFERVFTDKSFSSSSAKIDKRGKPKKDKQNPLKRYYRLEDEEEEKEKKGMEEAKGRGVESDKGSEESESVEELKMEEAKGRGVESDKGSEESESESESESEEELKKPGKRVFDLELKKNLEESESEEDEEEDGDEDAVIDDGSSTDTMDSDEENEIDSEEDNDIIPVNAVSIVIVSVEVRLKFSP